MTCTKYIYYYIHGKILEVVINQRFRNSILQVKGYPGEDCDNSDHVLIVTTMKVRLKEF